MLRAFAGRLLSLRPRRESRLVFLSMSYPAMIADDIPGLVFRELTNEDLDRGEIFQDKGRRERFAERLSEGHLFFGLVDQAGQVVNYLWLCLPGSGTPNDLVWALGSRLRIRDDSGFIFDCRTHRDWRGRGLYTFGLGKALQVCSGTGANLAFIDCGADNVASRRGIEKAGFTRIGQLSIVRLGSMFAVLAGKSPRPIWGAYDLPDRFYQAVEMRPAT